MVPNSCAAAGRQAHRARPGQEVDQAGRHGDRPGSRPPAAVRGGEGLVQVHVHDVESHVARPHDAEDGVEVGPVVVEQAPHLMDGRGDGLDVLFEQPQRVGVGQHDPGHVRVEDGPQRGQVDTAPLVAGHGDRLVAAQRDRGRIGAVGRVRDDHPVPGLPPGPVVRPHQQQPGQLPRRAGRRLQRGRGHPGHLAQRLFELDEDLQPALAQRRRRARVHTGQARAVRPPCRTAWGCTSWCTSPVGRHRGRPRTAGGSGG